MTRLIAHTGRCAFLMKVSAYRFSLSFHKRDDSPNPCSFDLETVSTIPIVSFSSILFSSLCSLSRPTRCGIVSEEHLGMDSCRNKPPNLLLLLHLAFLRSRSPILKKIRLLCSLFPTFFSRLLNSTQPAPHKQNPHVRIPSDTCNITYYLLRRTIDGPSFLFFCLFPPLVRWFPNHHVEKTNKLVLAAR